MKKVLFSLSLFLLISGCGKEDTSKIVTSISLENDEISIKIDETKTLKVIHTPSDLPVPSYVWKSWDNDVAIIKDGKVTGISVGETTISVIATELGLTASCKIKVNPVEAETIILNTTNQELRIGDEFQLTATIEPVNTTDKSILWESNDDKIATVTDKGLVKAMGVGKAIITVTSGNISVLCHIEVSPIHVSGISLSHDDIEIEVTDEFKLHATVSPEDATNKKINWTSSDERIAKVNEEGIVLGISKGQIKITAKTEDGGYTKECKVTVTDIKVKGVSLNHLDLKLTIGESRTLLAIIAPENAANKSVKWTSSNPSVASIDQNGSLLTLNNGNTVITVETDDGYYRASCNVTVSSLDRLVTIIARGKNLYQTSTGFYVTFHSRFTNPTSKPIQILSIYLVSPFGTISQSQIGGGITLVNNGSQYFSFNSLFFESSFIDDAFVQMLEQYKVVYQFVSEGKSYQVEQNIDARAWGNI